MRRLSASEVRAVLEVRHPGICSDLEWGPADFDLAKKYGVSASVVRTYRREAQIKRNPIVDIPTEVLEAELRRRKGGGSGSITIASTPAEPVSLHAPAISQATPSDYELLDPGFDRSDCAEKWLHKPSGVSKWIRPIDIGNHTESGFVDDFVWAKVPNNGDEQEPEEDDVDVEGGDENEE